MHASLYFAFLSVQILDQFVDGLHFFHTLGFTYTLFDQSLCGRHQRLFLIKQDILSMFFVFGIQKRVGEISSQEFSRPFLSTLWMHAFGYHFRQNIGLTTGATYFKLAIQTSDFRSIAFVVFVTTNITRFIGSSHLFSFLFFFFFYENL
jgi:hypothetical protein